MAKSKKPYGPCEFEKVLVVSTAHISSEDCPVLTRTAQGILRTAGLIDDPDLRPNPLIEVHDRGYGYLVRVPVEEHLQRKDRKVLRDAGLSKYFVRLLLIAQEKGARWILIDRDADIIPRLPKPKRW